MYVHYKQSGELLSSVPGEARTPDAVQASAEKIKAAHSYRGDTNLEGLMVVPGAGNIVRGNKLREQKIASGVEDVVGRLATVQNTLIIARALDQIRVPVTRFISDNMGYKDPSLGALDPYDVEAVHDAYDREEIVIIAGGTGMDNSTTDDAVLEYAQRHKTRYEDEDVMVLKGTKFDGVYTADPKKFGDAERFSKISAHTMLDEYDKYNVVDERCLRRIIETGLNMYVYADGGHDLTNTIRQLSNGSEVGTLITAEQIEPVLAI